MSKAIPAKSKKHLSKKELKQDKLVRFTYQAEKYYHEHRNLVLGIMAAIVIVVLGIVFVRQSSKSTRLEDSFQLTLAKMAYGQGNMEEAKTGFQKVIAERGGSAAGEARYFLGRVYLEQGEYPQAETEFNNYLKEGSVDEWMDFAATTGLAAAFESQGKLAEAAQTYAKAAAEFPKLSGAPQALLDAARVYQKLGERENTIRILQEIRDKYPKSTLVAQAKRQLDELQ